MLSRFFLMAVVVVASLSGAVAAQDAPNATAENSTDVEQSDECSRYVTEHISLCSADYVDGEAVLLLDADRRERITVTEAVPITEHREINRDSFIVDGRTEVRLPVQAVNGAAGVTIDDGTTLYGVPLETSSTLIGGPFTASDAQAAGIGGGVGVALVTVYLVAKVVYGRTEKPERLA